MILSLEETFVVGEDTFFDSVSSTTTYGVTFEDDLSTGYLYAVETEPELRILDAVHIYNVSDVIDKHKPCTIKIAWTDDGTIALLIINNYCHAIFDFNRKAGYSRTGFPASKGDWCQIDNRDLTDELIAELLNTHDK